MDGWAVGQLVNWAAGKEGDAKTKAVLERQIGELADEFAGPTPTAVERVLAETAET
jgi:hypothetical protein